MSVFTELEQNRQVIIYGAGITANIVLEKLLYENSAKCVLSIAVTETEKNPSSILGIPVIGINDLTDVEKTSVILIATASKHELFIKKQLVRLGFKNIYSVNEGIYKEWLNESYYKRYINPYIRTVRQLCDDKNFSSQETEKTVKNALSFLKNENGINIARLVVVLGTKCSLKCKECNNLMPYFIKPKDLDSNKILNSLKSFLGKTQTLLRCELVGGEPFLSNNINIVLEYLINKKSVIQIEITTNGTVIPKESTLHFLKNSKVKVRISDYGTLVDHNKLILYLKNNKVNYEVLELGNWISPGGVEKRGRSKEKLKEYYQKCSSGYFCKTLFDGKIFSCARAASLFTLGYMKEKEFVEIREDMGEEEIKEFWLNDYSEACNYCDIMIEDKKIVKPAEQLK